MKSIGRYLKEVRTEMAKVDWPGPRELIGSTIISLILITIMSLYLFGVDSICSLLAQKVYTLYGSLR